MKRLFLAGVIASGCLLPSVEVDPSLVAGGGQAGDAQGQAGTHSGGGSGGGGATSPVGGSPDQAAGGVEAGAAGEATAGTTPGGSDVGGSGGSGIGGSGTSGSGAGGSGGGGMVGQQIGAFTVFYTGSVLATHIAHGPDDNYWVTDNTGNISRITPSGDIKTFTLPATSPPRVLFAIVKGPDAAMWFIDSRNKVVGRISLSGQATFFTPTMPLQGLYGLVSGPDGNLWGASNVDNVVFRLTPAGVFKFFGPTAAQGDVAPYSLVSDQTKIYATETGRPGITAISMAGVYQPFDFPATAPIATDLAMGDDGQVWYCVAGVDSISKMSPTGTTVDYPIAAGQIVHGPAAGPDNHMWFIDAVSGGGRKLLRAGYDGKIDYIDVAKGLDPSQIVAGGANDIWIASENSAQVARLDLSKL